MWRALCLVVGVASLVACCAARADAQDQIALSLNLDYSVRTNPNSGGNWTLVGFANSGSFGISSIDVKLAGISLAQPAGPTGTVNSDFDPAGFTGFLTIGLGGGVTEVIAYQSPLDLAAIGEDGHQNIFYGVGTLSNGSPMYPGQEMGTMSLPPNMPTLQNVMGAPWGVPGSDFIDESLWDIAVPLAQGAFSANSTPTFDGTQYGSVFTTMGTSRMAGDTSCGAHDPNGGNPNCNDEGDETPVMTLVRNNLSMGSEGDYNRDGVVNAADYVLWRNTNGTAVAMPGDGADGDGNGVINDLDYDFWFDRFGNMPGAGSQHSPAVSAGAVPEPSGALLSLLGLLGLLVSMDYSCRVGRVRASRWSAIANQTGVNSQGVLPGKLISERRPTMRMVCSTPPYFANNPS